VEVVKGKSGREKSKGVVRRGGGVRVGVVVEV